jgi:hypothetical protein
LMVIYIELSQNWRFQNHKLYAFLWGWIKYIHFLPFIIQVFWWLLWRENVKRNLMLIDHKSTVRFAQHAVSFAPSTDLGWCCCCKQTWNTVCYYRDFFLYGTVINRWWGVGRRYKIEGELILTCSQWNHAGWGCSDSTHSNIQDQDTWSCGLTDTMHAHIPGAWYPQGVCCLHLQIHVQNVTASPGTMHHTSILFSHKPLASSREWGVISQTSYASSKELLISLQTNGLVGISSPESGYVSWGYFVKNVLNHTQVSLPQRSATKLKWGLYMYWSHQLPCRRIHTHSIQWTGDTWKGRLIIANCHNVEPRPYWLWNHGLPRSPYYDDQILFCQVDS